MTRPSIPYARHFLSTKTSFGRVTPRSFSALPNKREQYKRGPDASFVRYAPLEIGRDSKSNTTRVANTLTNLRPTFFGSEIVISSPVDQYKLASWTPC